MLVLNSFAEVPKLIASLRRDSLEAQAAAQTATQTKPKSEARAQRKAREKAKKKQRALAIKLAKAKLEGRSVEEVAKKYSNNRGEQGEEGSSAERNLTPEELASPVSQLLFTWMDPMIWAGFRAPLQMEQVPDVNRDMVAGDICRQFERHWKKKRRSKDRNKGGGGREMAGKNNPRFEEDEEETVADKVNGEVEMVDIVAAAEREGEDVHVATKSSSSSRSPPFVNVVFPLFTAFGLKFVVAMALKVVQVTTRETHKNEGLNP